MKYTKEELKQYGLICNYVDDPFCSGPEIIIDHHASGDFMRYRFPIVNNKYISEDEAIDNAVDRFLIQKRKEKLIMLNNL